MYYAHLPARGLISLSGDDVIPFLQGLITNDARKLGQGQALYAALLSPQGKYLHDFFLVPQVDHIILDGEKHRLTDLKARLALYKLRSKVVIEILPESEGVVVCWNGQWPVASGQKNIMIDPRNASLGFRIVGNVEHNLACCAAQGFERVNEDAYDLHRINHGAPDGSRDMTPDKSFMLEFNMDALHAVDFSKGCYVGQEVTARTKYRAQLRKILCIVENVPDAKAPLILDGAEAGELLSRAGNTALAMVRTEALERAEKEQSQFSVAGTVVSVRAASATA